MLVKYVFRPKKIANCYYLRIICFNLGLVLRLNDHRDDYANVHLKDLSTYILVEKQEPLNSEEEDTSALSHGPLHDTPLTSYVPLLRKLLDTFAKV